MKGLAHCQSCNVLHFPPHAEMGWSLMRDYLRPLLLSPSGARFGYHVAILFPRNTAIVRTLIIRLWMEFSMQSIMQSSMQYSMQSACCPACSPLWSLVCKKGPNATHAPHVTLCSPDFRDYQKRELPQIEFIVGFCLWWTLGTFSCQRLPQTGIYCYA